MTATEPLEIARLRLPIGTVGNRQACCKVHAGKRRLHPTTKLLPKFDYIDW